MKITRDSIAKTVHGLLETGARKATFYLDEKTVVTATRRHRPRKLEGTTEILLTMGKPNYAGREFVKACKKAGEPFPVRRLQLKWWEPKKRKQPIVYGGRK